MTGLEKSIIFENLEILGSIFGKLDENIKLIEKAFSVAVVNREDGVKISGEEENVQKAEKAIAALADFARKGETVTKQNVSYFISMIEEGNEELLGQMGEGCVCITASGKPIKAKTFGQRDYLRTIASTPITLGVGPAGTGKTYLAVAMAVTALRNKQINRIVITRPAVEAGEKLGFLPGDLQTKVDPYLRPIHDALFDMLGVETYQKYVEKNVIEIAPLAYMRGRTLDDSFIILDEAQNTTCEQMKMFLTRMGFNSKIVITGDVTQIDLPNDKRSGLKEAMKILADIEGIAICRLTYKDVVRHELVQKIIRAYEAYDGKRESVQNAEKRKYTFRGNYK